MTSMNRFLITTLAEYQTKFWVRVGLQLQVLGHPVAFLSFDDRSSEMLVAHQFKVYSATKIPPPPDRELESIFKRFSVSQINYWLSHESFAFGNHDSRSKRRKLANYLLIASNACEDWAADGRTIVIQELGGFLSVVGSYFAARHHQLDNWFIEPSFFRGRMFFLRNDFAALKVPDDYEGRIPELMKQYLDSTLKRRELAIPRKDSHHYNPAWKKIVNFKNMQRLLQKVFDKYALGKKQEFHYIGHHLRTHARMLWSSYRLRKLYTPLSEVSKFVYYPLHVPGDVALTLRTPHLLDQLTLIDLVCRSVPASHCVAVKEHPAMIGAVDADRLRGLLHRYDNLFLLPPTTNNYEVFRKSDGIVSINSKSGAEAALLGKPVLVLGDAFYGTSPLVIRLDRIQDLPNALSTLLTRSGTPSNRYQIDRYFAAVWQRSFPGELYVPDPDNVQQFTNSLLEAVSTDLSADQ